MKDCTREALAIEIDTSLSSKRILRTLENVIAWRGKPTVIRTDNGPEFTSIEFEWWCKEHKIEIQLFNPAGLYRMVISKDSTACTAKPFLTSTCSLVSVKSEPSPKNGSKNTTNEDPMKHYRTEHPPNGNSKFNLNLTL